MTERKVKEADLAAALLAGDRRTLVYFEAPHRIAETLAAMAEAFGAERRAAVCRELTKTYEEVRRGPLAELARWAAEGVRGEITVVVETRRDVLHTIAPLSLSPRFRASAPSLTILLTAMQHEREVLRARPLTQAAVVSAASQATLLAAGTVHVPLMIDGSVSCGQYMRSINMKSPSGAGSQFDSLSLPGESF